METVVVLYQCFVLSGCLAASVPSLERSPPHLFNTNTFGNYFQQRPVITANLEPAFKISHPVPQLPIYLLPERLRAETMRYNQLNAFQQWNKDLKYGSQQQISNFLQQSADVIEAYSINNSGADDDNEVLNERNPESTTLDADATSDYTTETTDEYESTTYSDDLAPRVGDALAASLLG